MRLILKNLRQAEFEINVESSEITVKELKLQIEKIYSYDSEKIKLLYKGSLLEDLSSLKFYQITENSTIIMMNLKNKEIENKPINSNSNNNNNPIEQNKPKVEKTETKEEITDILKDNLNITINSLVDMGFEKSQVEIAVKAANGRIDLAIEYLNNGIPDNIKNNNNSMNNNNTRNKNKNEIMNELKKQASIIKVLCKDNKNYIFYLLDNIKKNDPGLLKLITDYRNEFEKLLDEPITEEDEKNYKNIETKADEIISKRNEESLKKLKELGDKFKEEKEKEEKEEKEKYDNKEDNVEEKKEKEKEAEENKNDDKKEEKNEKEEDKKEQVENNEDKKPEENKEKPQSENNEPKENTEEVKNEVEKENEDKNDKVENKEENINKENEDNNENENKNENNNENNNDNENQLTEQDKEVISRLQNLGGFSYDKVFEAYIVCNKNEELTANYLFESYN